MTKPIAVVISDVHYSLPTLEVADKCMRQAIAKANELKVPLIVAGDLHDTKANLRGECVKAILDTFDLCTATPIVLVGNHDKINEKSDIDSLEFLRSDIRVIRRPIYDDLLNIHFIPYQHDPDRMRVILKGLLPQSRLIIHQGRHGALPGSYSHDRSALSESDYSLFKVISGHYHNHQKFYNFTYIGSPYTLTFAETGDHEKGFLILNDDFTTQHVRTNVRKHMVIDMSAADLLEMPADQGAQDDIVLVKIRGPRGSLLKISRKDIEFKLNRTNFILDLIPTDSEIVNSDFTENKSATELFTLIVDKADNLSKSDKEIVKNLWKAHST